MSKSARRFNKLLKPPLKTPHAFSGRSENCATPAPSPSPFRTAFPRTAIHSYRKAEHGIALQEDQGPDDVRPSADLPDRDPRNGLTDTWRVVPGDRLVTFEPGGLPKSWRISAVRRNAADLSLVVNDHVTGEPVEPDLIALLSDGCFDFDMSRETPEWQGFWKSEHGMVAYRDASGFVRRWTPGHGLGAELVSPAERGLWFDVPDASLAKLAGQGCRV